MYRILLDARPIGDGRHGIGRYVLALAPHLAAEPGVELIAAAAPAWAPHLRSLGARVVETGIAFTSPLAPLTLARIERAVRPDVTFCPSFVPPWPSHAPLVMTLHDATHLLRPQDYSAFVRLYYRFLALPVARHARVITVSEFSKSELQRLGGLRDVVVIPNAVDHAVFRPDGPRDPRIPEGTVLYVGGFKPHKRVPLLVDAVASIDGARLALVGRAPGELVAEARARLGARLIELGSLEDAELAAAYRAATVFAYPSELEGFGLPPLEAMACGTPVVVANASSLPEVVGEAGVLFEDADGLARDLRHLMADGTFRQTMASAGLRRATEFAWGRTGEATLAALGMSRGE